MANIKRAVNNKTAKDMLGESFRRQLLMDGLYSQLVFVATQADEILPSEVKKSLGGDELPADASIEDCAKARNKFTKSRIQDDFYSGIEEMHRMAGEAVGPDSELRQKYSLPVFCVSAVLHCRSRILSPKIPRNEPLNHLPDCCRWTSKS